MFGISGLNVNTLTIVGEEVINYENYMSQCTGNATVDGYSYYRFYCDVCGDEIA